MFNIRGYNQQRCLNNSMAAKNMHKRVYSLCDTKAVFFDIFTSSSCRPNNSFASKIKVKAKTSHHNHH